LQSWKITKLRRRIEQLESQAAFRLEPAPMQILTFWETDSTGKPVECECPYVMVKGRRFDRQPGETSTELAARIRNTPEGRDISLLIFFCDEADEPGHVLTTPAP
jgi:hypothetical protein